MGHLRPGLTWRDSLGRPDDMNAEEALTGRGHGRPRRIDLDGVDYTKGDAR